MTLILDATPLVAMHDRRDPQQAAVEELLRSETGAVVIPAPVTAEIDYLLAQRLGEHSRQAFLADLAAGRYRVECLAADDYNLILDLERRYADAAPGLADLSIVVLAWRFGTERIATFDERHFRLLRPLGPAAAFTLLPDRSELESEELVEVDGRLVISGAGIAIDDDVVQALRGTDQR